MTLTRRGRIVATIAATLAAVPLALLASLDYDADAAPLPLGVSTSTPEKVKPAFDCRDRLARILHGAGFRGQGLRTGWAVVMRESNGQNLGPGHPAFNGADYGIWQINAPAHSGASWWSTSAMLDPHRQTRIVYRWTKGGRYWQPWGLTRDGQLDATQYGNWSSEQHEAWIMAPFRKFSAEFDRLPKGCRSS